MDQAMVTNTILRDMTLDISRFRAYGLCSGFMYDYFMRFTKSKFQGKIFRTLVLAW